MPPMPFPMPLLFITAVKDICAINTFEKLLNILFSEVYCWYFGLTTLLFSPTITDMSLYEVLNLFLRWPLVFQPFLHRPLVARDVVTPVLRGQRLLAFSVYTAYYHMLAATSIRRNFLEEKTNSNSPSRHLLRKVNRRVSVLFRKVDIDRPSNSSQRHIENATAHTWERGWGWRILIPLWISVSAFGEIRTWAVKLFDF